MSSPTFQPPNRIPRQPGSSPGNVDLPGPLPQLPNAGGFAGGTIAGAIEGKLLSRDKVEALIARDERQLRALKNPPYGRIGTLKGFLAVAAAEAAAWVFTEGTPSAAENAGKAVTFLQLTHEHLIAAKQGELNQLRIALKAIEAEEAMAAGDSGTSDTYGKVTVDPKGSGFTVTR